MTKVPGKGLVEGLGVTLKALTRRSVTQQYPDVEPELPPRSRGVIALLEENCTVCMLCARECPDWCIYIDSHKETLPATTEGGRERQRNVLDRFAIDFSLCMYCGICIEVCPFDALHWSPEFEYAEFDILDLLHEKDRLGQWMPTVPSPPALDPASAEAQEVTAANKPPRKAPEVAAANRPPRKVPDAAAEVTEVDKPSRKAPDAAAEVTEVDKPPRKVPDAAPEDTKADKPPRKGPEARP